MARPKADRQITRVDASIASGGVMRPYLLLPILLCGCAGRDPQPIATVQLTDANASCAQITGEIQANNIRVQQLADEQGMKVGQNVAAGVAGLIVWPLFFA